MEEYASLQLWVLLGEEGTDDVLLGEEDPLVGSEDDEDDAEPGGDEDGAWGYTLLRASRNATRSRLLRLLAVVIFLVGGLALLGRASRHRGRAARGGRGATGLLLGLVTSGHLPQRVGAHNWMHGPKRGSGAGSLNPCPKRNSIYPHWKVSSLHSSALGPYGLSLCLPLSSCSPPAAPAPCRPHVSL